MSYYNYSPREIAFVRKVFDMALGRCKVQTQLTSFINGDSFTEDSRISSLRRREDTQIERGIDRELQLRSWEYDLLHHSQC